MKEEISSVDKSSVLLITFIVVSFITSISNGVIQSVVDNWCQNRIVMFTFLCLQIIRAICFILPALAIKNKTYRIAGIILATILIAYLLVSPVLTMIKQ